VSTAEAKRVPPRGPRRRPLTAVPVGRGRVIKLRDPSPLALESARDLARRINNRPAEVRNGFVERLGRADQDPPLAHMLRGGQGGSVRLKLLLSLLWVAVRPPHETEYPARGWAALLDLEQPETNGARRVTAAFSWLAANRYIRVVPNPGAPATVYLKDERGNGKPYKLPAAALKAKKETEGQLTRDDYWVSLPATFWTEGWIAVLRAPAVAMLLVMLDEAGMAGRVNGLWQSPQQAQDRFGLSQDTRTDGLLELEAYGIVGKKRSPVSPGVFDFRRLRNVYDLYLEQLDLPPRTLRPSEQKVSRQVKEVIAEITKTENTGRKGNS
jgi:hypothetical protein